MNGRLAPLKCQARLADTPSMVLSPTSARKFATQARADAACFFTESPESEVFDHLYPSDQVRVRVLRSDALTETWRVLIFDGLAKRFADPIWDSANP
jgi:hypothetical protein